MECKRRKQVPIKRCKHFELGGDKKRKVNYTGFCFECFVCQRSTLILNFISLSGTNDPVLIFE